MGEDRGLDAVGAVQPGQDVPDVRLDRALPQVKPSACLGVGQPEADQYETYRSRAVSTSTRRRAPAVRRAFVIT